MLKKFAIGIIMLIVALSIGAVSAADGVTDGSDTILLEPEPDDPLFLDDPIYKDDPEFIEDDPGYTDDPILYLDDPEYTDDPILYLDDPEYTDDPILYLDDPEYTDIEPIYTIQDNTGAEDSDLDENVDPEDGNITSTSAENGSTDKTIPMQKTGTPLTPLAFAALIGVGGFIKAKIRG